MANTQTRSTRSTKSRNVAAKGIQAKNISTARKPRALVLGSATFTPKWDLGIVAVEGNLPNTLTRAQFAKLADFSMKVGQFMPASTRRSIAH